MSHSQTYHATLVLKQSRDQIRDEGANAASNMMSTSLETCFANANNLHFVPLFAHFQKRREGEEKS